MEDTPRSTNSSGTPRDDRFFSPRETSSRSTRTNSSSEGEWATPRQEKAVSYRCNSVSSDDQYFSARHSNRVANESDQVYMQQHVKHQLSSNFESPRGSARQQYQQQNSNYKSDFDNSQVASKNHRTEDYNYSSSIKNRSNTHGSYEDRNSRMNDLNYNGELIQRDDSNNSLGGWAGAITEEDVQAIFTYARRGRSEEIETLLNKGIPVDIKDEWGNTVLIIACQNGNKRIVKNVLRRGANINCRNFKGNSPLHYCFHYGYGDTLGQYIIQKGADEGARNSVGQPCWDGV